MIIIKNKIMDTIKNLINPIIHIKKVTIKEDSKIIINNIVVKKIIIEQIIINQQKDMVTECL